MKLYLIRHGSAISSEKDPERPLSDKGYEEVGLVSSRVSGFITADLILCSKKLRAKQTAKILSDATGIQVEEKDGLLPNDDPETIRAFIETGGRDIVIAGHLPHLARLASLLLSGKDEPFIDLDAAAILCLEKKESWQVRWLIPPGLFHE